MRQGLLYRELHTGWLPTRLEVDTAKTRKVVVTIAVACGGSKQRANGTCSGASERTLIIRTTPIRSD